MSQTKRKRPEPRLKDWRTVETLLTLRGKGLSNAAVAKQIGWANSRLGTFIARVRWMAQVPLGDGVPIGTGDQRVAREFKAQWEAGRVVRTPTDDYRPMSSEESRAVSDAIRKVARRAEERRAA